MAFRSFAELSRAVGRYLPAAATNFKVNLAVQHQTPFARLYR